MSNHVGLCYRFWAFIPSARDTYGEFWGKKKLDDMIYVLNVGIKSYSLEMTGLQ